MSTKIACESSTVVGIKEHIENQHPSNFHEIVESADFLYGRDPEQDKTYVLLNDTAMGMVQAYKKGSDGWVLQLSLPQPDDTPANMRFILTAGNVELYVMGSEDTKDVS